MLRETWKIYNLSTQTLTIDNVGVVRPNDNTEITSVNERDLISQDPYMVLLLQSGKIIVEKYLDGELVSTVNSSNATTGLLNDSQQSVELSQVSINSGSTNGPNQLVQLNEDGELVGSIINRTMTTASSLTEVIPSAQLVFRTDDATNTVMRGDGVTAGGLYAFGDAKHFFSEGITISSTTFISSPHLLFTIPNAKQGEIWKIEIQGTIILNDVADFSMFDIFFSPFSTSLGSFFYSNLSDGPTNSWTYISGFDNLTSAQGGIIYPTQSESQGKSYQGYFFNTSGIHVVPSTGTTTFGAGFYSAPTGDATLIYSGYIKRIK